MPRIQTINTQVQGSNAALDELHDLLEPITTRRVPALYRVRELMAVPPSLRWTLLRQALGAADRGWPLLCAILVALAASLVIALLLVPQRWPPLATALVPASVFGVSFMLARRAYVRRYLRARLASA